MVSLFSSCEYSLRQPVAKSICPRTLTDPRDPPEHQKKIAELVNKYSSGNLDFLNHYEEKECLGRPQLLDAVSSGNGLPRCYPCPTYKAFSKEIEDDILDIIELMPDTLNCSMGFLKCRKDITPLAAACHNENLPLPLIEILVKKGCNPEDKVLLENKPVSILESLKSGYEVRKGEWISKERREEIDRVINRVNAIEAIFNKHILGPRVQDEKE